jgi:hypothetical protein
MLIDNAPGTGKLNVSDYEGAQILLMLADGWGRNTEMLSAFLNRLTFGKHPIKLVFVDFSLSCHTATLIWILILSFEVSLR